MKDDKDAEKLVIKPVKLDKLPSYKRPLNKHEKKLVIIAILLCILLIGISGFQYVYDEYLSVDSSSDNVEEVKQPVKKNNTNKNVDIKSDDIIVKVYSGSENLESQSGNITYDVKLYLLSNNTFMLEVNDFGNEFVGYIGTYINENNMLKLTSKYTYQDACGYTQIDDLNEYALNDNIIYYSSSEQDLSLLYITNISVDELNEISKLCDTNYNNIDIDALLNSEE